MSLLDRNDETSAAVWELIRSLATNHHIYKEVLGLDNDIDASGTIQWQSFFENKNVYRRIYNLEIIEAVMEEDEQDLSGGARVRLVDVQETAGKVIRPPQST